MPIRQSLANAYLCWFSKPKCDRELFRCIKRNTVRRIVELGVDSLDRSARMIQFASAIQTACGAKPEIKYASIDLFDARPADRVGLKLKEAHRRLSGVGASIQLVPGDILSGLSRVANQLADTDLLIISPACADEMNGRAWSYVPRMLASTAQIYQTSSDLSVPHQRLTPEDVDRLVLSGNQPAVRAA